MEGRGRGRGRGEGGGGRGRGGGGGRGRAEGGGRGGHRGDSGSRGRGDRGWGQQHGEEPSRGPQFPGSGGSHYDRGSSDHGPRQRDGDWRCPSCGFNNFAKNHQCYKCQADKSGASGGGGGGSEGPRQRDGDWRCPSCGFNNFAKNHQCYKCQADKSGASGGGAGGSEGQHGGWGGRQGGGQRGRGHDDGGFQRGGGRGRGDWGRGGRGAGEGGRGGRGGGGRGGDIDWAAQEAMETASQSSSNSDPAAEAAKQLALMKLNDLPTELANEDKNKYSIIPHRINKGPRVGTRGRQITIEVNHLKLTFDPKKTVAIYYDCAFDPDKLSRKVLRKIMNIVREKHYPKRSPAFDGKKNLYSCQTPLFKGKELNDTVELPPEDNSSKPLKVKVTIKEVEGESRIDLTQIAKYMQRQITVYPQKPVQVMEIVLRNAPASAGFTQVGRSFFTAPRNPITLGNGMELYHGFYQSVVLGWQTYLNVDVAHKGFPEARDVIDVMCEFKRTGRNPKPHPSELRFNLEELENFRKHIKGLRVFYAIPGIPTSRRKYTVIGVKRPANSFTFTFKRNDNDAGREMTIEEYFRQEKRCKLMYPHLPCLHVGDPKRNVCLPPEMCKIVEGQVIMKKLDPDQTRSMIKEAAQPPNDRKQKITNAMRTADFNQDNCVQEFGVSVGQQFTQVPARILTPPTIDYGSQRTAQPENGEWRVQTFKQATSLDRWAIASASSQYGTSDLRQIIDRFQQVCREVGMTISEPYRTDALVQDRYMSDENLNRVLLQAFHKYKQDQVQIVVMLIPDKAYDKVKTIAETIVGLLTQCILEKTMRRMDASTGKNLLLKINSKLNGVNHTVIRNLRDKLPKGPDNVMELLRGTMLMGADVTHPSPDQKEIPSVAAVTASHDPLQFQYNMVWRLQPPKQEIIGDLQNIVIKHLRFYKTKNGRAPDRIIFYRDGVSEGQFIQVLQVEMTCIKWACRKELGKDLPITFLVVQKRHHTRFFPTSKDHMDRKGNVPPGTVVDTNITHAVEADFYMVSHASLQGTSRPTKYHKLWDDNQINEDDLEELTFFLCHMFSRCTRSVSYPAPTYYAHLAAARGKVYLQGAKVNIDELDKEMERRTVQANIVNESPMFFT